MPIHYHVCTFSTSNTFHVEYVCTSLPAYQTRLTNSSLKMVLKSKPKHGFCTAAFLFHIRRQMPQGLSACYQKPAVSLNFKSFSPVHSVTSVSRMQKSRFESPSLRDCTWWSGAIAKCINLGTTRKRVEVSCYGRLIPGIHVMGDWWPRKWRRKNPLPLPGNELRFLGRPVHDPVSDRIPRLLWNCLLHNEVSGLPMW